MPWYIRKQFKDAEERKVFGGFLDESTLLTLYRLSNRYFHLIHGTIKRGKESNVLVGESKKGTIASFWQRTVILMLALAAMEKWFVLLKRNAKPEHF